MQGKPGKKGTQKRRNMFRVIKAKIVEEMMEKTAR